MTLLAVFILLVSTLLSVSANPFSFGSSNCRMCINPEDCLKPPGGSCEYGQYPDSCDFVNCFRGPGQRCSSVKLCASGLSCFCGKCSGCYFDDEKAECFKQESACTNRISDF